MQPKVSAYDFLEKKHNSTLLFINIHLYIIVFPLLLILFLCIYFL